MPADKNEECCLSTSSNIGMTAGTQQHLHSGQNIGSTVDMFIKNLRRLGFRLSLVVGYPLLIILIAHTAVCISHFFSSISWWRSRPVRLGSWPVKDTVSFGLNGQESTNIRPCKELAKAKRITLLFRILIGWKGRKKVEHS